MLKIAGYFIFLTLTAAQYREGGNEAPISGGRGGVEIAGSQEYSRREGPQQNTYLRGQPVYDVPYYNEYPGYYDPVNTGYLTGYDTGYYPGQSGYDGGVIEPEGYVPQNAANSRSNLKNNIVVNTATPGSS